MPGVHQILAPSAAYRWAGQGCHGSVALVAGVPKAEQSQEAKEGDAAHWAAASILTNGMVVNDGMAPNGIIVTDEMVEAADVFVADVIEKCGSEALDVLHIEEPVQAATIIHPNNGGTPDVWWAAMAPGAGAYVYVYDFKFGHRFVDAFENWQLMDYAAGILERPEFASIPWERIEFIFSIVQPRNYHPVGPIRRWTVLASDLRPYFEKMRTAAYAALGPNAQCVTGPACWDCEARARCETLHNAADGAMDLAGAAVPMELPPVALGVELRMMERALELLEARATGLREEVKSSIRQGVAVPFFGLEQGNGRERWTASAAEVIATAGLLGVTVQKTDVLITPNQARNAGMDEDIVKGMSERPKGELKLVPVDTQKARKVFG